MTLPLPALKGTNPLGFLAALGALDIATRHADPSAPPPQLWWSDTIEPEARLEGVPVLDEFIALVDGDRVAWSGSPVLEPRVDGELQSDVKLSTKDSKRDNRNLLREWIEHVHRRGSERDLALLHALVAEGATMGNSPEAKPTHFHFTAGQQRFLHMVRTLQEGVTTADIQEAIVGPWRFASPLPSLGWDTSRGDRIYALRGFNPSSEKKLGVPGAEWLAVLGLRFFPVATRVVRGRSQLVTTACSPEWKRGTFTWPLWGPDQQGGLPASVVQSLLADDTLAGLRIDQRRSLGVTRILRAPITRSDQGGYGSFGPSEELVSMNERISAMIL